MIGIVDYGAGNLGSVYKAFRHIGAHVTVSQDPSELASADAMVLPGVGAFTHCMTGLGRAGLTDGVRAFIATGRPFLGICVGLQMLFDTSDEMGVSPGLGVLTGRVVRFDHLGRDLPAMKVPHIGWNRLSYRADAALFQGVEQGARAYFVHSFYAEPAEPTAVSATTDYGYEFCAAVEVGNVHATQFHPEKSGAVGLQMLRNFAAISA